MAAVGLVLHEYRPEATELARLTIDMLESGANLVRLPKADAAQVDRIDLGYDDHAFGPGLDLVVSIGGDGTMLRAVHLVVGSDVPVLGVHAGHLGYLTEVEPKDLHSSVGAFLAGDYQIEERMLVAAGIEMSSGSFAVGSEHGLNEVVVEKAPSGRTVRLAVSIDGEYFHTYATDGLIVATPTGSTAYSFSARGPIVAPDHRALILTPVAPHMLFDRSLVLRPGTSVRIEVAGHRPATVAVDGRHLGTVQVGDAIVCTASPLIARLVTFGPRNFHGILKTKFGLNDR